MTTPTQRSATTCEHCGAPVVWAKTQSKRDIPLDPKPKANGNIVLRADGSCELLVRPRGDMNHVSHAETCKKSALHPRPRTPDGAT